MRICHLSLYLSLFFSVHSLIVSEIFQLYNVNDANSAYKIQSLPLAKDSSNNVVISANGDTLSLQIDYNGYLNIDGTDKYVSVDTSNNGKLSISDSADKSHIFYITNNHILFDKYFKFIACASSDGDYEIYANNNTAVCDNGIAVNFRAISTLTSNSITSFIPDILRTSQGVQIAKGESIAFDLTNSGSTDTTETNESGSSVATASAESSVSTTSDDTVVTVTEYVSSISSVDSSSVTVTETATLANTYVVLSKGYSYTTLYSTTLVPVTSKLVKSGHETVVVVTTVHVSKQYKSTSTNYNFKTVTKPICHVCGKQTVTVTKLLSENTLSLLTTRLHNTTSSTKLKTTTKSSPYETASTNSTMYGKSTTISSSIKSKSSSITSSTNSTISTTQSSESTDSTDDTFPSTILVKASSSTTTTQEDTTSSSSSSGGSGKHTLANYSLVTFLITFGMFFT